MSETGFLMNENDKEIELHLEADKNYYFFIESDYCSWCHIMKGRTFKDVRVDSIMNEKFIFIPINLHEKKDIIVNGTQYVYHSSVNAHGWVIYLTQNEISTPVSVLLNSSQNKRQVLNGYILTDELIDILSQF